MEKVRDEFQDITPGQVRLFRGRVCEVIAIAGEPYWPRGIKIRSAQHGRRVTSWLKTYSARVEFAMSPIVKGGEDGGEE